MYHIQPTINKFRNLLGFKVAQLFNCVLTHFEDFQTSAFKKKGGVPSGCVSLILNTFLLGMLSGFDGLQVACWPLVPKFAGSNAFLRKGSKAVCPMS